MKHIDSGSFCITLPTATLILLNELRNEIFDKTNYVVRDNTDIRRRVKIFENSVRQINLN